jgi:hypothetical protein
MPKARRDNMLVLSANKPNVGVASYTYEPIEAVTGPRRVTWGPAAEANDTKIEQGVQGAARFNKINTIRGMKRGRKAEALDVQTPMNVREGTMYDRTDAGKERAKPKKFGDQLKWSAKNSEKRTADNGTDGTNKVDVKEVNREAFRRRKEHEAAKLESEVAQAKNFKPQERKPRVKTHEGLDQSLVNSLVAEMEVKPSKQERRSDVLADNKRELVEQARAKGLNAASEKAKRFGVGSDDNIRALSGDAGLQMELLLGKDVPVLRYEDADDQNEKN